MLCRELFLVRLPTFSALLSRKLVVIDVIEGSLPLLKDGRSPAVYGRDVDWCWTPFEILFIAAGNPVISEPKTRVCGCARS
jgi:hypothetical protein